MIAGLSNRTLIAPFLFKGYCNKDVFEAYVEQVLIKELKPGQIVIMDNINFHKAPKVKKLIESAGCELRFLPTYSPDLNPIEHTWFKIKNHIRKMASSFTDILSAASFVLSLPF